MAATSNPLIEVAVVATVAIPRLAAATMAGAIAPVGAEAAGFAQQAAKVGETFLLSTSGTQAAIAGAAVVFGDKLQVGANGSVVPLASGVVVGIAFNDAAPGDEVEVHIRGGAVDGAGNSVSLLVSGTPGVGNTLTASFPMGVGSVKWQDSADNVTWVDIASATSMTFLQTTAQAGKKVRPVATSYVPFGASVSVPSIPVAPLYFPRLLLLGPSTMFRNMSLLTNQAGFSNVGQWNAAMRKGAYMDHRIPISGSGLQRDNQAADSATFAEYAAQVTALVAVQAAAPAGTKYVIGFSPGRNDLSAGMDATTYMTRFRTRLDDISARLSFEAVIVEGLWQRMSSNGGVWGIGGAARETLKALLPLMQAEIVARGARFYYVDENSIMRDPAGVDDDPRVDDVASDGVHFATQGADRVGEQGIYPILATLVRPRDKSIANPNNVLPLFTGTAGTLGGGATGVVYTGWEVAREAADHVAVASQVVIDGESWTQIVITANNTTPSKSGGCELRLSDVTGILHGKAADTRMGMRCTIRIPPTNVNYGVVTRLRDLGGTATTAIGALMNSDLGYANTGMSTDNSGASVPIFWTDKTKAMDLEYTTSLLQLKDASRIMPLIVIRPGYSSTPQSMTVLISQPETFVIAT